MNDREGAYSGRGPKGYKRPPGSLEAQICDALNANGYVDASEIEVDVVNGEVTLKGAVSSREQKRYAEDCAASVQGITAVHNHLAVDTDADSSGQEGSTEFGRDTSTSTRPERTLGKTPDRSRNANS